MILREPINFKDSDLEINKMRLNLSKITWLYNRFKAMSAGEILWRLQQKSIKNTERKRYKNNPVPVTELTLNDKFDNLTLDINKLGINWDNEVFTLNNEISLFDMYSYEKYRKQWHAGFQTENSWPLVFSYDLDCTQRIDIGDVRTNWELNRHFQFCVLAKSYYASGNQVYLEEFLELFHDWNEKNPFLHGVAWTSPMEVAIRLNSWIYSYCFIKKANGKYTVEIEELIFEKMRVGILNMTEYVTKHYSRFSSANNHLIVEACSVGLSGMLFGNKEWVDTTIRILSHEIIAQNYSDGVNKELSLHYQTFFMEAVGLLVHVMQTNNILVPRAWIDMLDKMSQYVSNCIGNHGEVIVFGDNDEGKVLDLSGHEFNHYKYVLDLMGCILDKRYTELEDFNENIRWLYSGTQISDYKEKPLYKNDSSICYKEGGNTILKSHDGRILIGIDHAALGFGSIAAHGHADALSFQMFVDGVPVFVDPGTYNYHITPEDRDSFRKTENHNTITINGQDQSQMLGPFLWGKRADVILLEFNLKNQIDLINAEHNGYFPLTHKRKFTFNKEDHFKIQDSINGGECEWSLSYLVDPLIDIEINSSNVILTAQKFSIRMYFITNHDAYIEVSSVSACYSNKYNNMLSCKAILVKGHSPISNFIQTDIYVDII